MCCKESFLKELVWQYTGRWVRFREGMIQARSTSRGSYPDGISVRVVTYHRDGEPEIAEVSASGSRSATSKISSLVDTKMRVQGRTIPARAVSEVVENLIHADYQGVVISVMDGGETVRVSDQGPGIKSKSQALKYGFSGATREASSQIRGIGAGLGIALQGMEKIGGTLTIDDNLGGGTVVTLSVSSEPPSESTPKSGASGETVKVETGKTEEVPPKRHLGGVPEIDISERQERTLITVLECGEVGPSTIAEMVDVSVSTAYRDLSVLEDHGLATSTESGKRVISPLGKDYAAAIIKTWVR